METTQNQTTQSASNKNQSIIVAGIIAVLGISFIGYKVLANQNTSMQKDENEMENVAIGEENSVMPSSEMSEPESDSEMQNQMYINGEYTEEGEYLSPAGPEKLKVTLTLKDGVIADAMVQSLAENPTSMKFQKEFVDNFKPMVIGKNANDLMLDKVAGSSLSPKGFNDALEKIKTDASEAINTDS